MSSSAAAQRREARQRKILENAESRLSKVLGEKTAPSVDGLLTNKHSLNNNVYGVPPPSEKEEAGQQHTPGADTDVLASPKDRMGMGRAEKTWYHRKRLLVALMIGALFRVLVRVVGAFNAVLPWCTYQLVVEMVERLQQRDTVNYPSHGHVVDFLLSFGVNQSVVMIGGSVADLCCRLLDDAAAAAVAFFLTDRILLVFSHLISTE